MSRGCRDLTGERFGRYTVIKRSTDISDGDHAYWECKCDCGNVKVVRGSHLTSGNTVSCGCYAKENGKISSFKHGMIHTHLYNVWHGLKERCNDVSNKRYGGRGIKVCDRWNDKENGFMNFYNDMGESYKKGLQIDRIDNNNGYSPENCRWSTARENTNNRECTVKINGKPISDIMRDTGENYWALYKRAKTINKEMSV